MTLKLSILSVVIAAVFTTTTGCQNSSYIYPAEKQMPSQNTFKINDSILTKASQVTQPYISTEDFLNAVKEDDLKRPAEERHNFSDPRLKYETYVTKQIYIDGDNKYIAAIGTVAHYNFVNIFKLEGHSYKAISTIPNGEQPHSIRFLDSSVTSLMDHGTDNHREVIELTTYSASGSISHEFVILYSIMGDKVSQIWSYPVIWKDSLQGKENNVFDYNLTYSTYLFISSFHRSFVENPDIDEAGLSIVLNETHEVTHTSISQQNKVLGIDKTTNEKVFIWDRKKEKFIEKQSPDNTTRAYQSGNSMKSEAWYPLHRTKENNGNEIVFIDSQHGWKLMHEGVAAGSEAVNLLISNNGGNSWEKVSETITPSNSGGSEFQSKSIPLNGIKTGISFVDEFTGWISFDTPAPEPSLYVTHDRGKTWEAQQLPILEHNKNAMYTLAPPTFFTRQDGIIIVENISSLLYITHDGGKSWSAIEPPSRKGSNGNLTWNFSNNKNYEPIRNGTVTIHGATWRTEDAGRSWFNTNLSGKAY